MSTKQINIRVLQNVLRKGTLDLKIKMIQMEFKENRLNVNMISGPRNVITLLNLKNNMINFSEHDEVILRFADLLKPLQTTETILKYTNNETIDVKIFDGEQDPHVLFRNDYSLDGELFEQRHKCGMCDKSVIEHLIVAEDYSEFPVFAEYNFSPDLLNLFFQISAHAGRYGKVYLRLTNGTLSIDATDENNLFEDHNDCDFAHNLEGGNMVMCFDYENFTHLLNIVKAEMNKDNAKNYKIGFSWFEENESGLIRVFSHDNDETEEYMLLNRPV